MTKLGETHILMKLTWKRYSSDTLWKDLLQNCVTDKINCTILYIVRTAYDEYIWKLKMQKSILYLRCNCELILAE